MTTAAGVIAPGPARDGRIGWLEQTLGGITGSIERAIFTEHHARSAGWLQPDRQRDPRRGGGGRPGDP